MPVRQEPRTVPEVGEPRRKGRLNDRTLAALGIDPESASQAARRTATSAAISVRDLQHRLTMLGSTQALRTEWRGVKRGRR
jgi:hypothetical protein